MTLEQTSQKTFDAHYRVMNVVGDFSSYRCACGAMPWLYSHRAQVLSKAVEGREHELEYALLSMYELVHLEEMHDYPSTICPRPGCVQVRALLAHSSPEPAAPASDEAKRLRELLHGYFQQMRDAHTEAIDSCASCTATENKVRRELGIPERQLRAAPASEPPSAEIILSKHRYYWEQMAETGPEYRCACGLHRITWNEWISHILKLLTAESERLRGEAK